MTAPDARHAGAFKVCDKRRGARNRIDLSLPMSLAFAITLTYGTLCIAFFRAGSVDAALRVIGGSLGMKAVGGLGLDGRLWFGFALLALLHIAWRRWALAERLLAMPAAAQALLYGVAAAVTVSLMPYAAQPFFYFQFQAGVTPRRGCRPPSRRRRRRVRTA